MDIRSFLNKLDATQLFFYTAFVAIISGGILLLSNTGRGLHLQLDESLTDVTLTTGHYLLFAIGGIFLILGTMYWLLDIVGFDMNPQLSKVHYILTFLALIWLLPILQSKNAASLKTWITILGLLFFVGLMVFVWNIVRGIMKG